jgi:hypothetical protein
MCTCVTTYLRYFRGANRYSSRRMCHRPQFALQWDLPTRSILPHMSAVHSAREATLSHAIRTTTHTKQHACAHTTLTGTQKQLQRETYVGKDRTGFDKRTKVEQATREKQRQTCPLNPLGNLPTELYSPPHNFAAMGISNCCLACPFANMPRLRRRDTLANLSTMGWGSNGTSAQRAPKRRT